MNKLGDSEQGQSYLRQAIEINRACLDKKPDDDTFKRELANSVGQLATSELKLGHLEKARELYAEEGRFATRSHPLSRTISSVAVSCRDITKWFLSSTFE